MDQIRNTEPGERKVHCPNRGNKTFGIGRWWPEFGRTKKSGKGSTHQKRLLKCLTILRDADRQKSKKVRENG